MSKIVYQYNYEDCNDIYIVQTYRGVEIKKEEHTKALQGRDNSRIAESYINLKH